MLWVVYSIVLYLLLICTFALKKTLKVMGHTFYNKSYENVGVDPYLQPTGAWVLAPVMETALSQKSRWEKSWGPSASNKANTPFERVVHLPLSLCTGFLLGMVCALTLVHLKGTRRGHCSSRLRCVRSFHTRLRLWGKSRGGLRGLALTGGVCLPRHWCPQFIFYWMILLFLVSRGERS